MSSATKVETIIAELVAAFPAAFTLDPTLVRPVKLGIKDGLYAQSPISHRRITAALRSYCKRTLQGQHGRRLIPDRCGLCASERPPPGVGDCHPDDLDPSPPGASGPRQDGREPFAHKVFDQTAGEAVREHDGLGAANGVVGEQPERPALFGAELRARRALIVTARPSGSPAATAFSCEGRSPKGKY